MVICYSFPPHPGIGGRRWAKFTKQFIKKKIPVTVFNATNLDTRQSLWTDDVNFDEIELVSYEFTFQKYLLHPKNIFEKIVRKLLRFFLVFTKYTPDIITSLPNRPFWQDIEAKIKAKNIKNVVVTGDPFLFYYAAKLKKKVDINLIIDYRDLWNDHSFYTSYVSLSKKQQHFFEFSENYAVNNCDHIICVDQGIKETISKRVKNKTFITVINNGFDKQELNGQKEKVKNRNKIKIVFAGGISSDNNNLIEKFVDEFVSLKSTSADLFNSIELYILSPCDDFLAKKFKSINSPNFIFEDKFLDKASYLDFISGMHFGIIFISKEYTGSFATKFADYLNLNVLTISLGYKGRFSEFITKNKIGLHFDRESENVGFFKNAVALLGNHSKIENEIIEKFDLEYLANKVEELLI